MFSSTSKSETQKGIYDSFVEVPNFSWKGRRQDVEGTSYEQENKAYKHMERTFTHSLLWGLVAQGSLGALLCIPGSTVLPGR